MNNNTIGIVSEVYGTNTLIVWKLVSHRTACPGSLMNINEGHTVPTSTPFSFYATSSVSCHMILSANIMRYNIELIYSEGIKGSSMCEQTFLKKLSAGCCRLTNTFNWKLPMYVVTHVHTHRKWVEKCVR